MTEQESRDYLMTHLRMMLAVPDDSELSFYEITDSTFILEELTPQGDRRYRYGSYEFRFGGALQFKCTEPVILDETAHAAYRKLKRLIKESQERESDDGWRYVCDPREHLDIFAERDDYDGTIYMSIRNDTLSALHAVEEELALDGMILNTGCKDSGPWLVYLMGSD